MRIHQLFLALALTAPLATTSCFVDGDDDDDVALGDCDTKCTDAHSECTLACDDDLCIADCDSEKDSCVTECD
jgi:hypothetical protein